MNTIKNNRNPLSAARGAIPGSEHLPRRPDLIRSIQPRPPNLLGIFPRRTHIVHGNPFSACLPFHKSKMEDQSSCPQSPAEKCAGNFA
jgi:hypothetical protein